MKMRSYYNGGVYRLSFKRKNNFMHLAIRRALVFDTSAASLRSAAAKHTYAPQAAQQKKGAAERSRPGLTA